MGSKSGHHMNGGIWPVNQDTTGQDDLILCVFRLPDKLHKARDTGRDRMVLLSQM